MRQLFFVTGFLICTGHVFAQDLDSVLSEIKEKYDRIETFSADATIYEYLG
jgi:hypothetical protein